MPPDDAAVTLSSPTEPALRYVSRKGLFRLVVVTTLLNILSLSFYRFWARTRWRRHVWASILLRGDPLEYHGTGFEMFKGFLVALAVVAPALIGVNLLDGFLGRAGPFVNLLVLGLLSVVAQFYAWRYRASRTSWRGVRLRVEGGLWPYARGILVAPLIALLSGFILYPHCRVRMRARLLSMTALGDRRFDCDVRLGPLYKYSSVVWIGLLFNALWIRQYMPDIGKPGIQPDFSKVSFWPLAISCAVVVFGFIAYRVAEFRVIGGGLTLGEVRFRSRARGITVGAFAFIGISIIAISVWLGFNIFYSFIVALSGSVSRDELNGYLVMLAIVLYAVAYLGFAVARWAWITPWTIEHLVSTVAVENAETLDAVAAGAQDNHTRGEGLADSFDVGIA